MNRIMIASSDGRLVIDDIVYISYSSSNKMFTTLNVYNYYYRDSNNKLIDYNFDLFKERNIGANIYYDNCMKLISKIQFYEEIS